MEIKEFIEKAIEGGWKYDPWDNFDIKTYDDFHRYYEISDEAVFLNPKAWEAVGKVEGWGVEQKPFEATMQKEGEAVIEQGFAEPYKLGWKYKMNQMTPALISGKSLEEYIKTL